MNDPALRQLAFATAQALGFTATERPPWLAKLYNKNGVDECRELKQEGHAENGEPAILHLVDSQHGSAEYIKLQVALHIAYAALGADGAIKLPPILKVQYGELATAILWLRPEGKRMISNTEFGQPVSPLAPFWQNVKAVAELINQTQLALRPLTIRAEAVALIAARTSQDYYLEKFAYWGQERRQAGLPYSRDFATARAETLHHIFAPESESEAPLALSFNLFGNTDIVQAENGEYFLINGRFEAKPPQFLPAAWLWNWLLYSSLRSNTGRLRDCLEDIHKILNPALPPGLKPSFYYNLTERCFAGYFVDWALRRSPFADANDADYQRAGTSLREVWRNSLHSP